MAINPGDIVVDSIYLGDYNGKDRTDDSVGIVITIKDNQVLVYWFEHMSMWGKKLEYEWFDLNDEKDVSILNNMKVCYENWKDEIHHK